MPFPKIKAFSAADASNDSLDTYITQAIGKEPLLSFSKANDAPVQLFQLLHSLDQGWPLLSSLKVQLQKCDKCSKEFCSTINYRRHMRLHRRNLNLNKDSTIKNRSLLQAFWDKLSVEEATEIMSFKDVSLEGVPGSSIIKALTSFIRKPGFTALPQRYVKAGFALLDIVQARPSKFPISSQELFDVFDGASENTFLCAGAAESLHKYVFDGEAGKIGLEMRNVVACTSFLAEQKLVKACLAHKDAEALRYQKLLMEEEEAAQNRQAALLEKKRQKKLRQKEQREKELEGVETDDSPEDSSPSPPTSSPSDAYDSNPEVPETTDSPTSSPESMQIGNDATGMYEYHENEYSDLGTYQHLEHRTSHQNSRRYMTNSRWQAPKLRKIPNGFHVNHNYQALKYGPIQKLASPRDFRIATASNGGKVWTPKPKSQIDGDSHKTRLQIEANLPGQDKKRELLIGSISVAVGCCSSHKHGENIGRALGTSALAHPMQSKKDGPERPDKIEVAQAIGDHSPVNLWRPVGQGGQLSVPNCSDGSEVIVPCDNEEVLQSCKAENKSNDCEENLIASVQGGYQGALRFSSDVAESFLAKRWKEAIASNHLKLVLLPDPEGEPPGYPDDNQGAVPSTKLDGCDILGNADNHSMTNLESKSKIRPKPEKGSKVKYIPKQRGTSSN